jgi:hypothetical protein
MSKSVLVILMVFCFAVKTNAQFFIGLCGNAYGGITNVHYNPAIANSPYLLDINLIGAAANFNNNYVGIHRSALLHPSYFNNPDFQSLYLHERVNGRHKRGNFGAQVQGPLSFMFSFGPKKNKRLNAVAFSYHANALFNADNITELFARTAYHGLGYQANAITNYLGRELYNANFSLKGAVWNDFGITYSRVVYNKNGNLISAGATLKILQPIAGAYGYVRNLNYQWTEYEQLNIYNTEAKYAYSDGLITSQGSSSNAPQALSSYLKNAMAFKAGKPSAAVDMGVVYEWWPDKKEEAVMDCHCNDFSEKSRYKLAAGFSMIDLGALRFKRGEYSRDFYADIHNWYVGNAQFPNGLQSLDDTLSTRFVLREGSKYFTIWLPTRFNLFVDYNMVKDFGVTFNAIISPDMSPQKRMVHHVTTFSVTGKYDNKWLGVYVPLSFDLNGNVSLGTTLRLGPLTIGTQDLLWLFAKKFVYNADIHAALKVTIPHGKICKRGDIRFEPKNNKRNSMRF